ncbi:U6 snRNA-associated Sm-like protein LSm6, partial [Striga asiatica]
SCCTLLARIPGLPARHVYKKVKTQTLTSRLFTSPPPPTVEHSTTRPKSPSSPILRAVEKFVELGILACLDGYMNIAMEQTEEYVNGQLKNKYGDAFIRGNNVLYISTSKGTLAEGA